MTGKVIDPICIYANEECHLYLKNRAWEALVDPQGVLASFWHQRWLVQPGRGQEVPAKPLLPIGYVTSFLFWGSTRFHFPLLLG